MVKWDYTVRNSKKKKKKAKLQSKTGGDDLGKHISGGQLIVKMELVK